MTQTQKAPRQRTAKTETTRAVATIDPKLFEHGRRVAIAAGQNPENEKAVEKATGGIGLSMGASYCSDKEIYVTGQLGYLAEAEMIRSQTKKVTPDFATALYGNTAFGGNYEGNKRGQEAVVDVVATKLGDARATGSNVILINLSADARGEKAQAYIDMLLYAGELLPDAQRQQWENSKVLLRFIGGETEEPVFVDLFSEGQVANETNQPAVNEVDRNEAIDQGETAAA
jgi:hypothetical protein